MFSRIGRIFADPMQLLYTLPAILIGLTVHEWAHAFSAYKLGDPTAKNLGRMTLDPFAHFDPIGLLCMFLLGFGWAKPVPINPRNFRKYKRDEIIVSLAGITANLLIAFVATFVFYLGAFKWGLAENGAFRSIMLSIVYLNLCLCFFNLIPIAPLDGSHVLECTIGHRFPRAVMFLRRYGFIILLILLATGIVSRFLGAAANWVMGIFSSLAISILA